MEFDLQYPLLLILATSTPDFDFLKFHFLVEVESGRELR